MEHWKLIDIIPEGLVNLLDFKKITANLRVLILNLENQSQPIKVEFTNVIAYRVCLEECVPQLWSNLHSKHIVRSGLWEIGDSNWIKELESNGGLAVYPNTKHFAFITNDNLVEVLTTEVPSLI